MDDEQQPLEQDYENNSSQDPSKVVTTTQKIVR